MFQQAVDSPEASELGIYGGEVVCFGGLMDRDVWDEARDWWTTGSLDTCLFLGVRRKKLLENCT